MLPTLSTAVRACRSPAARSRPRVPVIRVVSALLGVSALLVGCGNKGDLYLPSTLDDDRRLERIGAQGLLEPALDRTPNPPRDPTLDDPLAPTADELLVSEPPGEVSGDVVIEQSPEETDRRKRGSTDASPGAGS